MDASASMSSSPPLSPAATDAAVTTPTESEKEIHRESTTEDRGVLKEHISNTFGTRSRDSIREASHVPKDSCASAAASSPGSADTVKAPGDEDCAQQAGTGGDKGPGRDIDFYSKLVVQLCNERRYAALPASKRGKREGSAAAHDAMVPAHAASPLYDCSGL